MSSQALPVTTGVELVVDVPDGAHAIEPNTLPVVDVAGMPNASVAARAGWSAGEARLFAACARAPSDHYAPGVDELVFARATALVEGALGAKLATGPTEGRGPVRTQRADGDGARARHLLGFAGSARAGLLCTAACTTKGASEACDAFVESAALRGELVEPPAPGIFIRLMFASATHPEASIGIGIGVGAAIIALLLVRRPRRPDG